MFAKTDQPGVRKSLFRQMETRQIKELIHKRKALYPEARWVRISMAGRVLPSKISRNAPPPVEM